MGEQRTQAPTESRVMANGIGHHVLTWNGEARTSVVLCHGFLDMAWSFVRLAEQLASAGLRVVAFDWRGHGESDWVSKDGYYHFPDYLLDLDGLLPELAPDPVHLVGHSMGGTACAMYVGTKPDAVRSLVLLEGLGPPSEPVDQTPERVMSFLKSVTRARSAEAKRLDSTADALRRMRILNPDLDDELGLFLAAKGTVAAPDGQGLRWRFDPMHRTTSPMQFRADAFQTFLARITAPVLVVQGELGFKLPDQAARISALASKRLVPLDGVGHMMHVLAPARLADLLVGFFDEG